MIRRSLSLAAIVPLGLAACDLSTLEVSNELNVLSDCGEARSIDDSLRLPMPEGYWTSDDKWADIARQVPGGWGGFFLIDGRPTIYLLEPVERDEAVAALHAHGVGHPAHDVRTAEALPGRWDFAQLYDWYRYVNQTIWQVDGVVSSDIDELANRLVYGVQPHAMEDAEDALVPLDLPCALVVLEEGQPVVVGSG